MEISEEEAKTKWCPHARTSVDNIPTVSFNRLIAKGKVDDPAYIHAANKCMGSKCMAWTWIEPDKLRDIDLVTGDVEAARKGRCGLCS